MVYGYPSAPHRSEGDTVIMQGKVNSHLQLHLNRFDVFSDAAAFEV
jgi:hypothetical protein